MTKGFAPPVGVAAVDQRAVEAAASNGREAPVTTAHYMNKEMKNEVCSVFLAALALTAAASLSSGDGPAFPTYVGNERVAAALASGGTMVTSSEFVVTDNTWTANGHPELHEKQTAVFYVADGEATFVTGGKMLAGNTIVPGQIMGTEIVGGRIDHLSKRDVIVIPAGVPHWYKQVPHSIACFVVKVLKPYWLVPARCVRPAEKQLAAQQEVIEKSIAAPTEEEVGSAITLIWEGTVYDAIE
jgi:mannose-6-phosphate isomerase-like protein (cupin superfamily)